MGVVASLAGAPVTIEIFKDELTRERNRRDEVRFGKYHVGNTDLTLIKKLNDGSANNNQQQYNAIASELNKDVEKIYLTGQYREKYKYISNKMDRQNEAIYNPPGSVRKVRSAYPNVRLN